MESKQRRVNRGIAAQPARGPSRLSRREFLHLAGVGLAGAALSACAPAPAAFPPGDPQPSTEIIQLVYQDWRTDWFPPMVQSVLADFNETHPNIRVFYTPDPENVAQVMLEEMARGTAPDVFQGCCDFFPIWAQQGGTLDLRSYVESDLEQATINEWSPAQYQAFFLSDGHQFGLPKYHGGLALYYNRDLFDAYDVDYPTGSWNHDDYLDAMILMTRDRDSDGRTDLWGSMVDIAWERIQVHVNGWGGHLIDPQDPTLCRMNETTALAAMEWLRTRMWDDRVMASFLDVQNMETRQAFISERIAMVEDGSWALKDILTNAPFRIGVAPFPAGPSRRVTLASTDGFGIYARSRHPDAAWELLKFLCGEEYGRAMAQTSFLQPARASLVEDWVGFIRAEFPEKAAEVDIAAFADGHLKGYSVTAEIAVNMADVVQRTSAAWARIFTLGEAPVDEMIQICEQMELGVFEMSWSSG
ncbi:MAG: sugar ABC transporter substrate-binding protein [Caldilineaceae bacterium]|nr:sugar ABC transporter substrate-binding protein [Caldilineaceae bacterium]